MSVERNDFIRDIIDEDLRSGRHTKVATRFPPEPNGYLHIGHAKAICVDFGVAQDYQGTCNLRYDDTNPAKEDVEYVAAIEADVRWLGFAPTAVLWSADYFPRMYEIAEQLVRDGKAYVCDLTEEQIREYRGTLSEPGKPSPFRERSVDENLDRLRRMKAGEFPDGACVLRAKIDMASANMKMRDPLLYRIRHVHHHRSGDAWKIYPMYDYAHPLEDALEGITHSICTLEFENNRELYDWVLDNTGPWTPRPHQYEMARLVLDYTVMSKRKLLTLVQQKHVSGWDDPRMPTMVGMRRRGYSPEAIRAFCEMIGVAKANSSVDIGKLEYCLRDDLNKTAPRVMGVLRPIEVELTNWTGGSESFEAASFPADVGKPGARALSFSGRVLIDQDDWRDEPPKDFQRLGPGRTVRLKNGYAITADEVVARDGNGHPTKLRATVHLESKGNQPLASGTKPAGVIHWVDAATAVGVEARLYGRLFKVAKPEEGGVDFLEHMDKDSLQVLPNARVEASVANAPVGTRFQFERVGYFVVDEDSRPGALVVNQIITLRDAKLETAKPVAAVAAPVQKNPKAQSRPKGKSPTEFRTEARARNERLAHLYAVAQADGLSEADADLLTGDIDTAELFEAATKFAALEVGVTEIKKLVAKWMINELPRALDGASPSVIKGEQFGLMINALHRNTVSPTVAKIVLADMVKTGKPFADLVAAAPAAPTVDLAATVDAVIAANADKAAMYKAGKTGLLGFFVGQVMKSAPNADAALVNQTLRDRLA